MSDDKTTENQETGHQIAPVVTRQLLNNRGETYWLTIAMVPSEAGRFLREMWENVGGVCCPQTDEEALGEWTDRGRDVRSKYDHLEGIKIHTHAWHPDGDKHVLHEDVLRFLRGRGLSV